MKVAATLVLAIGLFCSAALRAQETTFEELFKAAIECVDCSDTVQIALYTQAIKHGTSHYLDFANFEAAWVNRGNLYSQIGEHQKAIADFQFVLDINPDRYKMIRKIATAHLELGQYEKAIEYFDRFIARVKKEEMEALSRFVANSPIAMPTNDTLVTIISQEVSEEFDGQPAMGYNNRGIAKAHLDDRPGACSDFRHALEAGRVELREFIKEYCP